MNKTETMRKRQDELFSGVLEFTCFGSFLARRRGLRRNAGGFLVDFFGEDLQRSRN